jgi:phage-related protein
VSNKKQDNFENFFWDLVFLAGGIWLLNKILSQPKKSVGIFGITYERNLEPYIDKNGRKLFEQDLKDFSPNEIGIIIREMIVKARELPSLSSPFFKPLKGTKITAELKHNHFRIMMYRISDDDYLMLSVFKKKTDETPKNEIDRAEKRLAEYLSR